ncbi:MAG: TIGR01777 family oxidoreductase [Verrucomicrobia bacterium]|nr:TIGR01777 family oxidoreductase [Verrucomicrobiota bacterium]
MRIGIIGTTGFIGSALARAANARGHEVTAFTRQPGLSLPGFRETRLVAATGPAIDATGLDAVVNLAGESVLARWTASKKQRIRESRIALTSRIVDSFKLNEERPQILINASGTGAYGHRGDEVLTESSSRGSGFLADVCTDWEAAAKRAESIGLRVVLLRTGMVLGKESGAWPLLKRIFRFGIGGRLGNGKQWMSWIHLDDEVGLIIHALEHPTITGPINLVSPNCVTNADFTRAVARAVHRPAIIPAPTFALRLVLGEQAGMLLDSQRVEPKLALTSGYQFRHPGLTEALASLL